MDIGDRALISGNGSVQLLHVIEDYCPGMQPEPEKFRFHGNGIFLPHQGDRDVHACFMPFLPVIPALEILGLFRFDIVRRVHIRQPGFPVQADPGIPDFSGLRAFSGGRSVL